MSQRNKAVLEEANAAISQGNIEGFLSFCAEEIEWTTVGEETIKGKEALRKWMARTYAEPPRYTVTNMIAEGDFLVALGDIMLEGTDGTLTKHAYCDVWRFRDDKMIELKAFVVEAQ